MPKTPNQLYLLFSPKSIPFAELVFYSLHLKDSQSLKLGIHRNLFEPHATLIVPKGIHSATRKTLVGKTSILRFFSRLAAENHKKKTDAFASYKVEECIERLRTAVPNDAKLKADLLSHSAPISPGAGISMADCWAFEYLTASEKDEWWAATPALASTWWSSFQPDHVAWARHAIKDTLYTIPVLDTYRYSVVEQVLKHTSITSVQEILLASQNLRVGSGLGLNIHKLKLGSIPDVQKTLLPKFTKNALISDISIQGPFINFTFDQMSIHSRAVTQALVLNRAFGNNSSGFGQFAICEYSSPNIAKPFHAGHLRSTIIGSFIQKTLAANGWETLSINYLGDWGKQYGLLAVGYEKYGNEHELQKDPIKHLYEVYVKINGDASENEAIHDEARAYFKKMEDGDEAALAIWKKFRDLSIVAYKDIYARINVEFDIYSGESQYSLGQMRGVLDELQEKKLLTTLEGGALAVDLKEYDLGTAVIGKTDGSMLYLSRDIAAASHRKATYDFDKMFYVVGTAQSHHFNQLFKILELQGKPWSSSCNHIGFGLIKSKDGNMSTRKGTVVFLQDILDNVKDEMHEVMKKNEAKYKQIEDPEHVADIVGISAIMIQDMTARRIKDYAFDWNRMLSFEGDTGPYLQYAHARLCSIERGSSYKATPENVQEHLHLLTEPNAHAIMALVSQYPDLIRELPANLEPGAVVNYSFRLAHAVSAAYTDLWVHGQPQNIAMARLALYGAARVCLGNALRLLGLKPLERM
ncbi:hypothetical protein HDU91_000062 [Kappamyces sp. JEL0680]|nr:hypothetical protein HDU91_000062 [Kappamyces sp. JEL0680]